MENKTVLFYKALGEMAQRSRKGGATHVRIEDYDRVCTDKESLIEILSVVRDYKDAAQYQLEEVKQECEALKLRLDKAVDLVSFVKKCLVQNGEYSPLSHQEVDEVLGINYYSKVE